MLLQVLPVPPDAQTWEVCFGDRSSSSVSCLLIRAPDTCLGYESVVRTGHLLGFWASGQNWTLGWFISQWWELDTCLGYEPVVRTGHLLGLLASGQNWTLASIMNQWSTLDTCLGYEPMVRTGHLLWLWTSGKNWTAAWVMSQMSSNWWKCQHWLTIS